MLEALKKLLGLDEEGRKRREEERRERAERVRQEARAMKKAIDS